MGSDSEFSVGFRFMPTDQELIIQYLLKKVNNLPLPWDGIKTCNLYDEKGEWRFLFQNNGVKSLYFFTELKKINEGVGSRIKRVTGWGTWKESQKEKPIFYNDHVIGTKRGFKFLAKEEFKVEEDRWLMDEFRLHDSLLSSTAENTNWVICHVKHEKELQPRGAYFYQQDESCGATTSTLQSHI